mmetsp:Transcript_36596/g.50333  ORF Transcript_36596/g.50333 Transcript_36596/m.50333 type:complete len:114 (-) Transcript_36596:239-580(-)
MVERRCAITRNECCFFTYNFSRAVWIASSDLESKEAVASSKRIIFGSCKITLAIETRCFSPPLKRYPLSPTTVSHFSGQLIITSRICAASHASIKSISVAVGEAYNKLFRIVS